MDLQSYPLQSGCLYAGCHKVLPGMHVVDHTIPMKEHDYLLATQDECWAACVQDSPVPCLSATWGRLGGQDRCWLKSVPAHGHTGQSDKFKVLIPCAPFRPTCPALRASARPRMQTYRLPQLTVWRSQSDSCTRFEQNPGATLEFQAAKLTAPMTLLVAAGDTHSPLPVAPPPMTAPGAAFC